MFTSTRLHNFHRYITYELKEKYKIVHVLMGCCFLKRKLKKSLKFQFHIQTAKPLLGRFLAPLEEEEEDEAIDEQ